MIIPENAVPKIAVVIPCYRVRSQILDVLTAIPPLVTTIYLVDDACPEQSGSHALENCDDARLQVLVNPHNLGVGGAMARGYRRALDDGCEIIVKMDGDDQMDAAYLPQLLRPILARQADYCKGNRLAFHLLTRQQWRTMPPLRRFGNALLSFGHKAISGYWNILDPANGFTAAHHLALSHINWAALAKDYFFETDLLFQLNLLGAVVRDVPMPARYGDEISGLRIGRVLRQFPLLLLDRCLRRVAIKYFLYDFNVASLQLLTGVPLLLGGIIYSAHRWIAGVEAGQLNSAGTVMLGALPIILGFQLVLAALSYDVANIPKIPLCADETAQTHLSHE